MTDKEQITHSKSKLINNLASLNQNLNKLNSFKRNFALSIVKGIGFAIGSTIVVGIIVAILVRISSIFLQDLKIMERLPLQPNIQRDLQEQIQDYENQIQPSYN